ncbi:hypothetical protein [Hydrogenophaga sp.]|uniref:hypothetical protein n=1 Tax=Hydrogenophaga sp. TaxID=1904254 RepID=UPI002D1FB7E3|nr:hypothetical protein [Hydrogenophaga sp.]
MRNRPLPAPLLYTYRRCPYAMRARMALLSICDSEFKHHLDRAKCPERFDETADRHRHRHLSVRAPVRGH